jgi:hypothetical protein
VNIEAIGPVLLEQHRSAVQRSGGRNRDVPGVIGYVGTVLGRSGINTANFSLGRQDAPASAGVVEFAS